MTYSLLDIGLDLSGGEMSLAYESRGRGDDIGTVDQVGLVLSEQGHLEHGHRETVLDLRQVVCLSLTISSQGDNRQY